MNQVTIEQIRAKIIGEEFLIMSDHRTTLCQLTLENGYTVIGQSACVDIENFDASLGRHYAKEDAINKIWPLEGYLLAERMHLGINTEENATGSCNPNHTQEN
jgi:hypothetical protein